MDEYTLGETEDAVRGRGKAMASEAKSENEATDNKAREATRMARPRRRDCCAGHTRSLFVCQTSEYFCIIM